MATTIMEKKICKVDECIDRALYTNGLCGKHNMRLKRWGDVSVTKYDRTHHYKGTPEYSSWVSMRQRCSNPNSKEYRHYGGRGIKVCERWGLFINFLKDMGERPSMQYSLERIDNNGNYEPANCKWGTKKEQALNRRFPTYVCKNCGHTQLIFTGYSYGNK